MSEPLLIKDNTMIIKSPVFELLASMFRLTSHEHMQSVDQVKEMTQDYYEFEVRIKTIRETLSQQTLNELNVFFDYETYIGLSMVRFAWEKSCYQDISAFINKLEETSSYELFTRFLQTGYSPGEVDFIEDTQRVVDYIQRSNYPDIEKWKLTYLYMNIDQTKERFIYLLRSCYSQYFKEEEVELLELQERSIQNLLQEYKQGGEETLRQILPVLDSEVLTNSNYQIVLAPSVYYHIASLNSEADHSFIYLYGINQPALFKTRRFNEKDAIEALKIISDEKRIKIIKLLSVTPYYGYEIAQKLELSNSTVSHHLSQLASIHLVNSVRKENKVYYQVNKKAVSDLMNRLTIMLT